MTAVHQILGHAAGTAPATATALGLQTLLRRVGASEIYAARLDPALEGRILPLADFAAQRGVGPTPAVVYHAGAGDPDVLALLLDGAEPVLLLYHHVPPAEPYLLVDPRPAERLALAEAQLSLLQPRVRVALADSEAAAGHLRGLGYPDVAVWHPPVPVDCLAEVEPHPPTRHHLDTQLEGPLLLCAGPVDPPERLDLLVEAYHALVTYLVPEAHLAMVGPAPVAAYADVIQGLFEQLDLTGVWIQPDVDAGHLAAFYRAAAMFVTTTEHPGFCVPAVQALGFDLPVVARAAGGVPETLAGAGLCLPPDAGPLLLAEAIAAVLDDPGLGAALQTTGRARLAGLDPATAEAAFLGHLAGMI